MDTITELMQILKPWVALLFLVGALLLVAGAISRWLHLASSQASRNLEHLLLSAGSRMVVGGGIVWFVLWAAEHFYRDLMAHLPGG